MKDYFIVEESVYNKGSFLVKIVHENLPLGENIVGSCNVLAARVLSLNWIDYLRMCRDIYGAMIVGKNEKYPVAYFKDKEKANELKVILNKRVSTILKQKSKNVEEE